MAKDFEGKKFKVGLSDTPVFPKDTVLTISEGGGFGSYLVTVTNAGECPPHKNPLDATAKDGRLTTEAFTVACEPPESQYRATAAMITSKRIAGAVVPATSSEDRARGRKEKETNGNPTGTYTAEEEGGGDVET
jgi:hypothetical protein